MILANRNRLGWREYSVSLVGLLLLVLGVAGAVRTGFFPLTETAPEYVLGFRLNPLHSIVLIVSGIMAFLTVGSRKRLKRFLIAQFIVFLLLFLYGTAVSAGSSQVTYLNLNAADNFLHIGIWIFSVAIWMSIVLTAGKSHDTEDPAREREPGRSRYPESP